MTYVITQNCCNDASCVPVCPVGCIHPTPDEPGYATTEMLYIDPRACIDCGACVEACPVDAVAAADELPLELKGFADLNAAYYDSNRTEHRPAPVAGTVTLRNEPPLRVAVVGAGPSGFYAAEELLFNLPVPMRVSMFDRLPTPFGLVRAGVAPDHLNTKAITDRFRRVAAHPHFSTFYNVEIGEHLSHEELLAHHHAVIYTTGMSESRRLGIAGEDLVGSSSANEFVGWYNGNPGYANAHFDLTGTRAVVVGTGNVALDIARILLGDIDQLARTDIADHALATLAASTIEQVVVLGRRNIGHAAFTSPELLAFAACRSIDVVVDPRDLAHEGDGATLAETAKVSLIADIATLPRPGRKQLVLRFLTTPVEILGSGRVQSVRVERNRMVTDTSGRRIAAPTGETELIDTALVVRAIGYHGVPLPGLPFDPVTGSIPNRRGRVMDPDTNAPLPGVYTAGWIKRGPSGAIGTNGADAGETVAALLEDHENAKLNKTIRDEKGFADVIHRRQPHRLNRSQWQRLDEHELHRGREESRPRVKLVDRIEMLRIARPLT
jgi:ferredoxin--NADP+ reductase